MAEGKATIHEIASSLLQPSDDAATQSDEQEEVTPTEGNDEGAEPEDAELEDEELEDDGELDQSQDDETLEEGEDEEDTEGDYDADSTVLDINDDDLIEVKIDGQIEYRSIAEAKKALSGEGAYDKRVKEATELRKQAQAEHTQLLERFTEASRNFESVLGELEQNLFTPQTAKPDAKLKQSNPDAYYRQLADYQAEQETLNEGKKQLRQLAEKQQEQLKQQREEYRQQQAKLLGQALPELNDPEKAEPLVQNMVATAKEYGFTEEEINQALDHRYYKMVADLAKLRGARGAKTRKANTVKNLDGQRSKRPRKLRSGATALKAKARKQSEQQKQATETARKSGKVKDVARTLITKRG